jgi:hypothetical protein
MVAAFALKPCSKNISQAAFQLSRVQQIAQQLCYIREDGATAKTFRKLPSK